MKVIVCGAGQVGFDIARQLSAENNDVTVVDHDHERLRKVNDALDVLRGRIDPAHLDLSDQIKEYFILMKQLAEAQI